MRLPAPMLARSGPLPTRRTGSFELKWDGFRALVSTLDGLTVRSRRGWNMTKLVPELAKPPRGVYDGELVASMRLVRALHPLQAIAPTLRPKIRTRQPIEADTRTRSRR